jgi:hypothetical protein
MKDFGEWFRQGLQPSTQSQPAAPVDAARELYPLHTEAPDGTDLYIRYFAKCRRCERRYELPCDPEEFTHEGNYCGGSPSCLP